MLVSVLLVVACGGKKPEPVMVKRPGDENKNCKLLAYDIGNIEYEIHKLLPETKGKTVKNVAYGVAGYFTFFIPWLLIDFNNAEAKEYEALRARHDHLARIAEGKDCQMTSQKYPSIDDVKKDYEIFKGQEPDTEANEEELDKTIK